MITKYWTNIEKHREDMAKKKPSSWQWRRIQAPQHQEVLMTHADNTAVAIHISLTLLIKQVRMYYGSGTAVCCWIGARQMLQSINKSKWICIAPPTNSKTIKCVVVNYKKQGVKNMTRVNELRCSAVTSTHVPSKRLNRTLEPAAWNTQKACSITRWQHFSRWNDITAAILNEWCQIENPTPPNDAYLLEEHSRQISSWSHFKRWSFRHFWRQVPQQDE